MPCPNAGRSSTSNRSRRRKAREKWLGTVVVTAVLAVAAVALVGRALGFGTEVPAIPPGTGGLILYGTRDNYIRHPSIGEADWFTSRPDGTDLTELGVTATCAVWFPTATGS